MTDVPPIEESWERLEAWLAAHAPASSARLNPPASPDAIDDAQRQMAIALPTDLVSSLLRHNGASEFDANGTFQWGARFLPGSHRLLAVQEIVTRRQGLNEVLGQFDETMVGSWWHPEWIPFAHFVAGDDLVIDQRLGPDLGTVGGFMNEEGLRPRRWPSLAAMITDVADAVERQRQIAYFRPHVKDGALEWEIVR